METAGAKIMVIGSINMDVVIRCSKIPLVGQTVLANSSSEFCGGKGANQAVAAAKAGGDVQMVGCVGSDAFAARLRTNLGQNKVDDSAVQSIADCASGLAVVCVDQEGQNSIVVVPGANHHVDADRLLSIADQLATCSALVLQLEIPIPTVFAAIRLARAAGIRVILDPAPVSTEVLAQIFDVDLICPNEGEAAALTGRGISSVADASVAAKILHDRGARNVAITMGSQGTWLSTETAAQLIASFPIHAVDTTAAGDAWAGAFAVRWCETDDLIEAAQFANAAGALAASREGAQASLATRKEIESLRQTG